MVVVDHIELIILGNKKALFVLLAGFTLANILSAFRFYVCNQSTISDIYSRLESILECTNGIKILKLFRLNPKFVL